MPYPAQINREQLIQQAIQLIEANAQTDISLAQLAKAVGVKPPSLYRYIKNRDELITAVNSHTLQTLFARFEQTLQTAPTSPKEKLLALLHTQRQFSHEHPHSYLLAFTSPNQRPDEALLVQMVLPIQEIVAQLTGPAQSLAALRGLLALVHGYILLELNHQLQRGGDLEADFTTAVTLYLNGLTKSP